jgi:hypothetical protein
LRAWAPKRTSAPPLRAMAQRGRQRTSWSRPASSWHRWPGGRWGNERSGGLLCLSGTGLGRFRPVLHDGPLGTQAGRDEKAGRVDKYSGRVARHGCSGGSGRRLRTPGSPVAAAPSTQSAADGRGLGARHLLPTSPSQPDTEGQTELRLPSMIGGDARPGPPQPWLAPPTCVRGRRARGCSS